MPDLVNKPCPRCGAKKLAVRKRGSDGKEFLACPRWPHCLHTEDLPPDIAMRRAGATPLPMMEGLFAKPDNATG